MSNYGIKIWNDKGSVQIDSSYRNIAYLKTLTFWDWAAGETYKEVPIDDDKWYVFEPQRFSDTPIPVLMSYKVEGAYIQKTYRIFNPCVIHVFGFVDIVTTADPYGMRIYNTHNELVYDNSFLLFKVVDYIKGKFTLAQIDSATEFSVFEKHYYKRTGFCISRQPQVSGYANGAYQQRCLHFTSRYDGYNKVVLKTAYTSGSYPDTNATTGTFVESFLLDYDFCMVDCSMLPS